MSVSLFISILGVGLAAVILYVVYKSVGGGDSKEE